MRPFITSSIVLFAAAAVARADMVGFITDYAYYDGAHATADGVYNPSEYSLSPITMSAASGGGGAITAPTASLRFNTQGISGADPTGSLTIGFQPGAAVSHTVIILLNYQTGGRTRGSGTGITAFNDNTDTARQALSSLQGALPSGSPAMGGQFAADAAITINSDGFGLFLLPDNAHATFTQIGSYTGVTGPSGFREARFDGATFSPFGLFGFDFAVVYADNGFLYNEAVPNQLYSAGPNPGQQIGSASPADVGDFYTLGIFIPSPGTGTIVLMLVAVRGRSRRR